MMPNSSPKLRSLKVRAVRVPMAHPHRTASGVVSESPLVLTDVVTDDGVVGHSIVFTYTTAALEPDRRTDPEPGSRSSRASRWPRSRSSRSSPRRFRLLGTQGLVGIALAAIDMALWDALARGHGTSLVALLGGVARPIPAYGAVGYDGAEDSARAAAEWAGRGFKGVKAKIGYPTVQEDVAVIRAIRKAVGDGVAIMVDYNQCLTPAEAVERLRVLDDEGLTWVEEPTLAHDYAGHALIAREAATPDPVRRELVGHARPAARHRRPGVGLHHARRDEDRRRDRLAARGGAGPGAAASASPATSGPRSARSCCA